MKKKLASIIATLLVVPLFVAILFSPPTEEVKSEATPCTPCTPETTVTQLTEVPETTEATEPIIEYTEPETTTEPTEVATEPTELVKVTEPSTEPTKPKKESSKPSTKPSIKPSTEGTPDESHNGDSTSSFYSYTEAELDLLARLIQAEGGGESYNTKLKIGSVVMNRVKSSKFPNTIRKVIYDKNQFSVTWIKIDGVVMIDRPASKSSYKAAKEVLENGSILPDTVMVFYSVGCKESWVTSRATYEVSDNTVFAHIYKG